jgi:predicted permease
MFKRRRDPSDFGEEVEAHLQIQTEELHAQGLTEEEARSAARRAFGNVGQAQERFFESRRWLWWDHFWQDVRLGARTFSRNPGFTAIAVLTLALGIGANTAIFSIFNRVLLTPLPFPQSEELVLYGRRPPSSELYGSLVAPVGFAHLRTLTDVLRLGSAYQFGAVNLTGGDRPERLARARVSADFFALFGAPLTHGRAFSADDDVPSGPRVAVLSGGLWARRFASDPRVIGKTILLDGEPHTIVGVVAASFDVRDLGGSADVYTPFQLDPNSLDQGNYFEAAARLMPGVSAKQADARVVASTASVRQRFPKSLDGPEEVLSVRPVRDVLIGGFTKWLLLFAGAVGLLLILACANVANLLMIRATGRRREIVLRATLGARRGRLLRQLLTESCLLALFGGVLGTGLGVLGLRALLALNGMGFPRIGTEFTEIGIDWRLLAFVGTAVIATGILFGILPALAASRPDLVSGLKEGGGRTGTAFRLNRIQSALVVGEIALAVVLLTGTALVLRSLMAMLGGERGFDGANVQTMTMSLRGTPFQTSAQVARLTRDATERVAAIPDVEDVTAGCCLPIRGGYMIVFDIMGRQPGPSAEKPSAWELVGPRYFEVFRIPIIRGRGFTDRDVGDAQQVAIINEAMAKLYWPDSDPLKDRIKIPPAMKELASETERQIVGIVGDVRSNGLSTKSRPIIYIPNAQVPDGLTRMFASLDNPLQWSIRLKKTSGAVTREVRAALEAASGLPVDRVESMEAVENSMFTGPRFTTMLMSTFGMLALALAAIGIYGVMAYAVKQRVQEIGIRMALGARQAQVRGMVIAQGMWHAVAGVTIGLGLALALARVVGATFFWAKGGDPSLFASVAGVLSLVALFSVWWPATRASAVDPVEALRAD